MTAVVVSAVVNSGWPVPDVIFTLFLNGAATQTPITVPSSRVVIGTPITESWTVPEGTQAAQAYVTMHLSNAIGSNDYQSNTVTIPAQAIVYYNQNTNDPIAAAALAQTVGGRAIVAPASQPSLAGNFLIGGPGSPGAPSWWPSMYDSTLGTPIGATNKCSAIAGISASNPYFTGTNSLGATFIEGWNGANTIALAQSYPNCPPPAPLSALHVNGNKIVDANGNIVVLRGVAVADNAAISTPHVLGDADFQYLAQAWNAKLVRMVVFPGSWHSQAVTIASLDAEVSYANKHGMYAIIDWHTFGNINTPGQGGNSSYYQTSLADTQSFWAAVAQHFNGNPGVFYEIYNEPSGLSWPQWQAAAQQIVNTIRQHDQNTIILVGGVGNGFDLSGVPAQPVTGPNIGYVSHPYANQCGSSSSCWDAMFGNTANTYPVVATEWGYHTPDQTQSDPTWNAGSWNGYGPDLVNYMKAHYISWTAWSWAPFWYPYLISSWTGYQPTQYGQFVLATLTG